MIKANPKSEGRNPKEGRSPKAEGGLQEHLHIGFVMAENSPSHEPPGEFCDTASSPQPSPPEEEREKTLDTREVQGSNAGAEFGFRISDFQ